MSENNVWVSKPVAAPAVLQRHTYTVGVLCAVYTLSCIDRNVVNILLESIKKELVLADWQLGVLTGIAFALFYTFLGIPLARYADRVTTNRAGLIGTCIAVWSVMTATCGLAAGFATLLLARMGVGIGEAGAGPSAHALIGDLVPAERRASAMGVYALGIPLGSLFGLSIGGALAQHFGWRAAFLIVGLPGLALALIVWLTVPEPRKLGVALVQQPIEPFWSAVRHLARSRVFTGVTLGATLVTVLLAGQGAFLGSFLIRAHGFNVGQAGLLLGLAIGGGGAIGSFFGGRIVDRFAKSNTRRHMILPIYSLCAGSVFFVIAIWAQSPVLLAASLITSAILIQSWYGPAFSAIQRVTPSTRRATAAAVHAFSVNLLGVGIGPVLLGLLSDVLNHGLHSRLITFSGFGSAQGLRLALLVLGIMPLLAALAFWRAAGAIEQEILPGDR